MILRRIVAGVLSVALLLSLMAGVSMLSVSAEDYAAWVNTHNLERYRGTGLTAVERAIYTAADELADSVRKQATAITAGKTSDADRLLAIHDWVAGNIAYDYDFYEEKSTTTGKTADEVLQLRRAVCSGIAELTMQLCRAVGIPCKTVDGYTLGSGETWGASHQTLRKDRLNHVWNEAYVNGRWQIIDVTWDTAGAYRDGTVTKGEVLHDWFDIPPASLSDTRLNLENITDGTFVYTQAADGTLTLSAPLDPALTTATIPAEVNGCTVVAVGEQAFFGRESLASVTLPQTVTTLGNRAFSGTALSVVPDMRYVTAPGNYIFAECRSLRAATIPAHWTILPSGTFDSCEQLTDVTLPSSITIIADYAFNKCSELSTLAIPTALQQVGKYAFAGTKIALSSLPESVFSIGVRAFAGTQITAMPLSDNRLSYLGERAFENCDKLTSVTLPDTLTAIADGLFSGCVALQSVNVPSRVETIGTASFSYCQALSALTLPEGLRQIGDYAFRGCSSLETLVVPNTVKTIGFEAFADCSALTSIALPDGLTALSSYLFRACTALQAIDIPVGVTEIGFSTFEGCSALKTIHFPAATTVIGRNSFVGCTALEAFTVAAENPVLQVRDGALVSVGEPCTLLVYPPARTDKTFTVSEEVKRVDSYAFSGAVHLEEVYVNAPMTGYSAWGIGAFAGCTSLRKLQMVDGVTHFSGRMFEGCTALEELTIPSTLTDLAMNSAGVLCDCTALEGLSIPEDNEVFYDVDGVVFSKADNALVFYPSGKRDETYTIPDGTPCIQRGAFRNNRYLTAVVIPERVERIEASAFYGCTNLSSVTLPQSLCAIGNTAFASTALSDFTLPDESIQLEQKVFFDTPWWNRQPDGPVYYEDILFDFKGEGPGGEVIVREGTRRITSGVMSTFWRVERLVIPASVQIIEAEQLPEGMLIVGTRGSAAEQFAKRMGCRFEDPNTPWGDADGNGKVNTTDARTILQYAANLIGEDDLSLAAADVNGDGKVNTTDARVILQYAANLIDKFPVEG